MAQGAAAARTGINAGKTGVFVALTSAGACRP